jgi:competence protein ComFC
MSYPGLPLKSALQQTWSRIGEGTLNLVYPRTCRACQAGLTAFEQPSGLTDWLCTPCLEELTAIEPPYCSVCGEAFAGAMERAFKCSNCDGRRMAFDFAISGFKAAGPLRELVHHFKYSGDLTLRGVLAEALIRTLSEPRLAPEDLSAWVLVPVPLHWLREMRRGFNQSWELCRELSARTGIPTAQIIRRKRLTSTQARLNRHERLENLRGVFALRRSFPLSGWRRLDIRGKKVLLVDDVLTTGATAHECAKVLKREAGAEKVVVITAARG